MKCQIKIKQANRRAIILFLLMSHLQFPFNCKKKKKEGCFSVWILVPHSISNKIFLILSGMKGVSIIKNVFQWKNHKGSGDAWDWVTITFHRVNQKPQFMLLFVKANWVDTLQEDLLTFTVPWFPELATSRPARHRGKWSPVPLQYFENAELTRWPLPGQGFGKPPPDLSRRCLEMSDRRRRRWLHHWSSLPGHWRWRWCCCSQTPELNRRRNGIWLNCH